MSINRSKAEILEAIGAGEPTAQSLIHRLSVLCELVREHRAPADCRFTLSTIHSAKGLEYDTVYLADVQDGVFPESTVINPKSAPKELLAAYEEERRLFYVGATRAKQKLFLFTYAGKSSQFCDELLGKEKPSGAEKAIATVPIGKKRTAKEIADFCKSLTIGEEIDHRAFGKGTLTAIDGDIISVKFESGLRKLSVRMLLEMHLLK